MSSNPKFEIKTLIDELLDTSKPLHPSFLYRLSDLNPNEIGKISQIWVGIPTWRRQALMEDLEQIGDGNLLMDFSAICRLASSDSDARVRELAIRIMGEYEMPENIEIFTRMITEDRAQEVRAVAATAMSPFIYQGEIEELSPPIFDKVEKCLLNVLKGDDVPLVRRRALEAIGFSSKEEVTSLIESAYYSGNDQWLASSLISMGRSANEKWRSLVEPMLDHENPDVRLEAIRAAGELETKAVIDKLMDFTADDDDLIRMAAIWSLSQIGGEGIHDLLLQLYEESEDEDEMEFIETALDNLAFTQDFELFDMFEVSEIEEDELIDNEIINGEEDYDD
jgi:HEAT repeat protein